jgi:hypothetical protein
MHTTQALRSAAAFFLVTFSTAFLMTIGIRLTGWFSHAPVITPEAGEGLGIAIMIGVVTLAVGAALRRLEPVEIRSALLGAASVLLAIPLSLAALTHTWEASTFVISGFGILALAAGLLVARGISEELDEEEGVAPVVKNRRLIETRAPVVEERRVVGVRPHVLEETE